MQNVPSVLFREAVIWYLVHEACGQPQFNVTSVLARNAVQACRQLIADHMAVAWYQTRKISGSCLSLIWVHPHQLWWVLKVPWQHLPHTLTIERVISVKCWHPSACWPGDIVIKNNFWHWQDLEHGLLTVQGLPKVLGTLTAGWELHWPWSLLFLWT